MKEVVACIMTFIKQSDLVLVPCSRWERIQCCQDPKTLGVSSTQPSRLVGGCGSIIAGSNYQETQRHGFWHCDWGIFPCHFSS